MKLSRTILATWAAMAVLAMNASFTAQAAGPVDAAELAVTAPVFLQLEITSTCTPEGVLFKIINRGDKWPRTGFLRLYHADDKSLISERRLRLGQGQKVSFVVKDDISQGRPVAVWVEPEWYKRDFEYDAKLLCGKN